MDEARAINKYALQSDSGLLIPLKKSVLHCEVHDLYYIVKATLSYQNFNSEEQSGCFFRFPREGNLNMYGCEVKIGDRVVDIDCQANDEVGGN